MLAPLLAVGWRSTECLVSSWCEEHTEHPDGQVSPPTASKQVFTQLSPASILWGKEAINSAGHWETQASPMLLQCRGRESETAASVAGELKFSISGLWKCGHRREWLAWASSHPISQCSRCHLILCRKSEKSLFPQLNYMKKRKASWNNIKEGC